MAIGGGLPEQGEGALAPLRRARRAGQRAAPRAPAAVASSTSSWAARRPRRSPPTGSPPPSTRTPALGLVAARLAPRGDRGRLAARPVRAAGGVRRRARHRRHDGQLHVPRRRAQLVGRAPRHRHRRGRPGRRAPDPGLHSGHIHQSATKSLGLLGAGRSAIRRCVRDELGRLDLERARGRLEELDGAPAIIVATAGEPNAAAFDPIAELADLARAPRRLAARRRRLRALRPALAAHARTSPTAWSARTPSPPTATSGSTSRTTAASPSSASGAT